MKQLSKIVWSEGMYLAPHHFQAQNRYFEDSVQFALTSLWRDAYGLISCEFNQDAIRNGTVALVHAVGVFPDGLPFDMPECDPLPVPRNIRDSFSPWPKSLRFALPFRARWQADPTVPSLRMVGSPQGIRDPLPPLLMTIPARMRSRSPWEERISLWYLRQNNETIF